MSSRKSTLKTSSILHTYLDIPLACSLVLGIHLLYSWIHHKMDLHRFGSETVDPRHKTQNNLSNLTMVSKHHQLKPKFRFAMHVSEGITGYRLNVK